MYLQFSFIKDKPHDQILDNMNRSGLIKHCEELLRNGITAEEILGRIPPEDFSDHLTVALLADGGIPPEMLLEHITGSELKEYSLDFLPKLCGENTAGRIVDSIDDIGKFGQFLFHLNYAGKKLPTVLLHDKIRRFLRDYSSFSAEIAIQNTFRLGIRDFLKAGLDPDFILSNLDSLDYDDEIVAQALQEYGVKPEGLASKCSDELKLKFYDWFKSHGVALDYKELFRKTGADPTEYPGVLASDEIDPEWLLSKVKSVGDLATFNALTRAGAEPKQFYNKLEPDFLNEYYSALAGKIDYDDLFRQNLNANGELPSGLRDFFNQAIIFFLTQARTCEINQDIVVKNFDAEKALDENIRDNTFGIVLESLDIDHRKELIDKIIEQLSPAKQAGFLFPRLVYYKYEIRDSDSAWLSNNIVRSQAENFIRELKSDDFWSLDYFFGRLDLVLGLCFPDFDPELQSIVDGAVKNCRLAVIRNIDNLFSRQLTDGSIKIDLKDLIRHAGSDQVSFNDLKSLIEKCTLHDDWSIDQCLREADERYLEYRLGGTHLDFAKWALHRRASPDLIAYICQDCDPTMNSHDLYKLIGQSTIWSNIGQPLRVG